MSDPIRRGAIFTVPDTSVSFPPRTLKDRHLKPTRPYLVVSNDDTNAEAGWPIVMGFPISTASDFRSEYDVEIAAGVGGLSESSWVQTVMLQPVAKTKLMTRLGQLPAADLERVLVGFARYVSLL